MGTSGRMPPGTPGLKTIKGMPAGSLETEPERPGSPTRATASAETACGHHVPRFPRTMRGRRPGKRSRASAGRFRPRRGRADREVHGCGCEPAGMAPVRLPAHPVWCERGEGGGAATGLWGLAAPVGDQRLREGFGVVSACSRASAVACRSAAGRAVGLPPPRGLVAFDGARPGCGTEADPRARRLWRGPRGGATAAAPAARRSSQGLATGCPRRLP